MAPRPRSGWRPGDGPEDARKAAALLLLYPDVHLDAHFALTLRTSHLPHHAGQVCLPGGRIERQESVDATALREAQEEVGVAADGVEILGHLSPLHIPVSGFMLHPVVAATPRRPSFVPSAHEVARVIDVPLAVLANPGAVHLKQREHDGRQYDIPYFLVDGEVVWGATAMVLSEFLAVLDVPPVRPAPIDQGGVHV